MSRPWRNELPRGGNARGWKDETERDQRRLARKRAQAERLAEDPEEGAGATR